VLASPKLATAIPALTGHPTWFGHPNWTQDFASRTATAQRFFSGQLGSHDSARLIDSSRARYVLVDCSSRVELAVHPGSLTPK
jgi:hypothetical protein